MLIVFVRTILMYLSLLTAVRLMGKRQLGELELSEFVVASLISNLASIVLEDTDLPLWRSLVPIFSLLGCELLMALATARSIRLRLLLYGKPCVLIDHGVLDQAQLRKNRMTLDELLQELRARSIRDLASVEYACLETDGSLSILLFPAEEPPSARALGVETGESSGFPHILISDGRVLGENLFRTGHDRPWLERELRKRRCTAGEVFLLTVDDAGAIYFVRKA